MSLPPESLKIVLHILQAYNAVILDTAADQESPPNLHYTKFGWDFKDGIFTPATANQPAGPH